jgi:outer membrane protein OmpA-like peptidoglycan-associated protein
MNQERTGMTVEIAGHTDATGPDDYNMMLSEWRAKAVTKYLTERGVSAERITTVFFGETKPKESNDTSAGRAKNRRVEFTIIKL